MQDRPPLTPPDLNTQLMDDANFDSTDLSKGLGILGSVRLFVRKGGAATGKQHGETAAFELEDGNQNVVGKIVGVQPGDWAIENSAGKAIAMLWRQHTADHEVDNLSSLVHLGFHRWDRARKAEATGTLYCVAGLDRTVRFTVTFVDKDVILDSPSNRPVLKLLHGKGIREMVLADPDDDHPVVNVHSHLLTGSSVHEVEFVEPEDAFPVAMFVVALGLEKQLESLGAE